MKNIHIFFLTLIVLNLTGCRKEFEEISTIDVVFQLEFPDNFVPGSKPANVGVTIKNNITGQVSNANSDANGQVNVSLLPGTYSVIASKSYAPEEALPITGYDQESFVNANVTPVVITEAKTVSVKLSGSKAGGLVIREFYYSGVPSSYFYDLFIEIYNNSNQPIRVDSMYMGNTKTAAASAYGFIGATQDSVFLSQVWLVPHEGETRFLQPGESLVLAMDGINHKSDPNGNANSPVNLGPGIADFETFWPYTNRDADEPDVPNLIHAYASATTGFDWLPGVNGCGLVIFNIDNFDDLPVRREPGVSAATLYKAVPVSAIIDGIETVGSSAITAASKRLPISVDAGMTTVGATYSGKSVRRKVKSVVNGRTIFVDTNNSSADFEVNNTPSPRKWN